MSSFGVIDYANYGLSVRSKRDVREILANSAPPTPHEYIGENPIYVLDFAPVNALMVYLLGGNIKNHVTGREEPFTEVRITRKGETVQSIEVGADPLGSFRLGMELAMEMPARRLTQ